MTRILVVDDDDANSLSFEFDRDDDAGLGLLFVSPGELPILSHFFNYWVHCLLLKLKRRVNGINAAL